MKCSVIFTLFALLIMKVSFEVTFVTFQCLGASYPRTLCTNDSERIQPMR